MTAKQAAIEAISRLPEDVAQADIFLAVFSHPERVTVDEPSTNGSSSATGPAGGEPFVARSAESEEERLARIEHYYANRRPFDKNEDIIDPSYDLMALREMDKPQFAFDGDFVD